MTKQEMINVMAREARISKAAAGRALEAYIQAVGGELKQTGKLSLSGSEPSAAYSARQERDGTRRRAAPSTSLPKESFDSGPARG
jgi:DNA-binding protein HU-beta